MSWSRHCIACATLALAAMAPAADERPAFLSDYAFEGSVDVVDPALVPALREGLVLSGLFAYDTSARPGDAAPEPDRARFSDVVGDARLTFDLNHVWVYETRPGAEVSLIELSRSDHPPAGQQELYSLLLPLRGDPLGDEGWVPRWLQIWFYLEPGSLPQLSLQAPPDRFRRGWWRMTFLNPDASESVTAEGRVTLAGPAGEPLNPSEEVAALRDIVLSLNNRLLEAQSRAGALEEDLSAARRRFAALQQTVDRLLEERQQLRQQLTALEEHAADGDERQVRLDELEAERALWTEQEARWKEELSDLQAELGRSRADAEQSRKALERLERPSIENPDEMPAPTPPAPTPAPSASTTDERETPREVIIIPSPVVTEARPLPRPAPAPEAVDAEIEETGPAEQLQRETVRRPGKFRRVGRR